MMVLFPDSGTELGDDVSLVIFMHSNLSDYKEIGDENFEEEVNQQVRPRNI